MTEDPLIPALILAAVSIAVVFLATLLLNIYDRPGLSAAERKAEEDAENGTQALIDILKHPTKYKITDEFLRIGFFACGMYSLILCGKDAKMEYVLIGVYIAAAVALGIIVPAKTARQHQEVFAEKFAGLQRAVCVVFRPVTFIFEFISDIVLRIFRQRTDIDSINFSEENVMSMLEAGEKSGDLKIDSKKLIGSIFRFDDEYADEIMTPRTDVFMIDINDPQEKYIDELMSLKYSRIPVYEDEYDNIIGILNIKDYLIKAREQGFGNVDIRPILREPFLVPETKNIDSLFREMQIEKQHIAILIDEYGGFSGIVTMEDIIEEIVGDIDDEYDEANEEIDEIGDGSYLVSGGMPISDLNERTGSGFTSETSETIGGLIIDELGEIPEDGYVNIRTEIDGYEFTILSVKEKRIQRLKMKKIKEENDG